MWERFNRKRPIQAFIKHAKWQISRKRWLDKRIYETFWDELKEIFANSVREAKEIGHLSTSQRQAIIKLIEKKDTHERLKKTGDQFPCWM